MEDMMELFKTKAKSDAMYAIAYAIMWNARDKRFVKPIDADMLNKTAAWLMPRRNTEVCNLQIWVECLNRRENIYTVASAREVTRVMNEIGNWSVRGTKRFEKYGVQKFWQYEYEINDSPDIDDI